MAQNQGPIRSPGVTYAVSNTGPLISTFQSNSFELLTQIFAEIHTSSPDCVVELVGHGWKEAVDAASSKLVVVELTSDEKSMRCALRSKLLNTRTHPMQRSLTTWAKRKR